jgi:hypothetical protein
MGVATDPNIARVAVGHVKTEIVCTDIFGPGGQARIE